MRPYIGITGFMSADEIKAVLAGLPADPSHDLMVGVLASSKTLAGSTNKYPGRYPRIEDVNGIFVSDVRILNLIHYATDDRAALRDELTDLWKRADEKLDGFQLNVAWPDPKTLGGILKTMVSRIVLQVGRAALKQIGNDPRSLAERVGEYDGLVSDVLIDPSGGKGVPFDPETARAYLAAVTEKCPTLGLGVAGGLSPATLNLVEPLVAQFPRLNIDAEGRLRRPADDSLDLDLARDYLACSLQMFSR